MNFDDLNTSNRYTAVFPNADNHVSVLERKLFLPLPSSLSAEQCFELARRLSVLFKDAETCYFLGLKQEGAAYTLEVQYTNRLEDAEYVCDYVSTRLTFEAFIKIFASLLEQLTPSGSSCDDLTLVSEIDSYYNNRIDQILTSSHYSPQEEVSRSMGFFSYNMKRIFTPKSLLQLHRNEIIKHRLLQESSLEKLQQDCILRLHTFLNACAAQIGPVLSCSFQSFSAKKEKEASMRFLSSVDIRTYVSDSEFVYVSFTLFLHGRPFIVLRTTNSISLVFKNGPETHSLEFPAAVSYRDFHSSDLPGLIFNWSPPTSSPDSNSFGVLRITNVPSEFSESSHPTISVRTGDLIRHCSFPVEEKNDDS